jgi:hypothetical protein
MTNIGRGVSVAVTPEVIAGFTWASHSPKKLLERKPEDA